MSISKSLQYYRQSPVLMQILYVQFDRVIREPPPRGELYCECVYVREKNRERGRERGRDGGRERERERGREGGREREERGKKRE